MLIRAIRRFREKTLEQYKIEEEKQMEPWKKDVLRLHEKADFLFYFDEAQPEKKSLLKYNVRGEIAKGKPEIGQRCLLYDGEGRFLGEAEILTDTGEEEEKGLGMIKMKKNQFMIRILRVGGQKAASMEVGEYQKQIGKLFSALSLVSHQKEEEK